MPLVGETTRRTPLAIGAYIFAGGFTLGVKKHFKVLCHLEESDYGVATACKNFPDLPIHIGLNNWPIEDLQGGPEVDFIYGNPPCAAWSVAGYTKDRGTDKWRTDPRVACTTRHFGLLTSLNPRVWAWESVTQAYTKGYEFVINMAKQAREIGYSTTILLHDAQWFGLPQIRKRFFMVCHRVEFSPIYPSWCSPPTPVEVLAGVSQEGKLRGSGGWSLKQFTPEVMARIQPGERLTRYWLREVANGTDPDKWERNSNGSVKGRPSYGHSRLPTDRPGGAVVGYAFIHPTENRFISPKEMQVLCGFPESYEFSSKGGSTNASEIARGVCPPVGEWLARSVSLAVRKNQPIKEPITRLVDIRKPPGSSTIIDLDAKGPSNDLVIPQAQPSIATKEQPKQGIIPVKDIANSKPRKTIAVVGSTGSKRRRAPTRPQGIGRYIRNLLREGKHTPTQIVEMVRKKFPESRATVADVSWNRARLAKENNEDA